MLEVEEAPEDANDGVDNSHASVERQLRNLGGRKLAVCIPKLGNGPVFLAFLGKRLDAVVSGLLNGVVHGQAVLLRDVDGLGANDALRGLLGVVGNDELAEMSSVAVMLCYGIIVADVFPLSLNQLPGLSPDGGATHVHVVRIRRLAKQVLVLPFEDQEANNGVLPLLDGDIILEELHEDERVDAAAP